MTKSVDELRQQAELCRRLAQDTAEPVTRAVLEMMAEDLAKAARAEEEEQCKRVRQQRSSPPQAVR